MKKTMSEIIQDVYKEELYSLEPVDTDADALIRGTFEKLGLQPAETPAESPAGKSKKAIPFGGKARGSKHRRGKWRVLAVAVILVMALTTAVYAAGAIYKMIQQKVGYFDPPASVHTPVSGPSYHSELKMDIEKYNASVGLSVTSNGKTVTLDTVAVDDNFINAFFTIKYDKPIDLNALVDGPYPAYDKLRSVTPWFTMQVDGKEIDGGFSALDEYDPYMADDSTVKMMVRWVVPTTLPSTFSLSLHGEEYSLETGDSSVALGVFHFDVAVDKSASAAVTAAAKPGAYTMKVAGGSRTLDLCKLAITPFGGVISVNGHWNGELNSDPAYLMPGELYITDDKGNVLNTFWNNSVSSNSPYYALELIGCLPDTKSITLTPIRIKENFDDQENRTYSVTDIGAKIEIDNLGGFYLEDYVVKDSRVSLVLRPYGCNNYATNGIVIDDEQVSLANGRSGLMDTQIDRKTGLVTVSVDYYAATPEELKAITQFHAYYDGAFELEKDAALTLPLERPMT